MAYVVAERSKWWVLGLYHIIPGMSCSIKVSAVGEKEAEGTGPQGEHRERQRHSAVLFFESVKAILAAVINP